MSDQYTNLKKRNDWLTALVFFLMLTNIGVLIINSGKVREVATFAPYEVELNSMENRLTIYEQEIDGLKDEIRIVKLPEDTPYLDFISIYNRTRDSVVLINTDLGSGSGWVYGSEGYVITNNHVIEDASVIEVSFQNGITVLANLIGRDPYSDMAVLKVKVNETMLYPLFLGSSSELLVGETVIAIGNPFGLANTMTTGIISATGRQMEAPEGYVIVDVIQTDAAINPGNSGGPLLNLKGEVIGMNTAIISNSRDSSGIGFAIPSDTISREVTSIIETSQFLHPWLGLSGVDVTPVIAEAMGLDNGTRGTLVVRIVENSPAEAAGIKEGNEIVDLGGVQLPIGGDILLGINNKKMDKFYELLVYLTRNIAPGDVIHLTIMRDGELLVIPFTVGSRPVLDYIK